MEDPIPTFTWIYRSRYICCSFQNLETTGGIAPLWGVQEGFGAPYAVVGTEKGYVVPEVMGSLVQEVD